MNKKTILDYATKTPENTNRNVLGSMLNQFSKSSGGITFIEPAKTETGLDLGYSYNELTAMDFPVLKVEDRPSPGEFSIFTFYVRGFVSEESLYYCVFGQGSDTLGFTATSPDDHMIFTNNFEIL